MANLERRVIRLENRFKIHDPFAHTTDGELENRIAVLRSILANHGLLNIHEVMAGSNELTEREK